MIVVLSILIAITFLYLLSISWVFVGFIGMKRSGGKQGLNDVDKKISIIIPARNEENNILSCLNSLTKQDYPTQNFEIIVVNDHSTDKTTEIVEEFIESTQIEISLYILSDKTTKKEALKYGIENANYEIIATSDADCTLPINWLQQIAAQFHQEIDMLIGPVMFSERRGFLAAFQTLDLLALQGIGLGALFYNQPLLNNGANLAYRKDAFNKVKGFDKHNTPSGDDVFLLEKFKSKHPILGHLQKDFIVETEPEKTVTSFLQQRMRWSSKAKYYSDKLLIYFGLLVLFQNVSTLFIYLGIAFVEKYCFILVILLICKVLIDFILLFLLASFFKRLKTLFYFIPVQLIYPFYIIIIWIASLLMSYEWKGRKFNE